MSRYPWYSLSGLVSRIVFRLAVRACGHPSELWVPLAMAYGMIEVGGLFKAVRIFITKEFANKEGE